MGSGIVRAEAGARLDARSERRLVWLLFARLVLSVVSLAIAIGLESVGRDLSEQARRGLYFSVAFAFLATAISGVCLRSIRRADRFAAVQIATDVLIVTLLVLFSGGRESVFTFLYVPVTVYGGVLFGRTAGLGAAGLAALGFGGVMLATRSGLGPGVAPDAAPASLLVAVWGVHTGALFLVGGLSSTLSGELERTGAALLRSTSDLRRLRDLHERTVESIMSGLLTTDSHGAITSFNPEAEGILGVEARSVLGRKIEEVIPGALEMAVSSIGSPRGSATPRTRLRYRGARGEDLHLGLAGSILRDVDGRPLGYVIIFQDVSRVVDMEAQLRQSERLAAVGEMAAKIAHEIRNPLASISGVVQVLHSDAAHREEGGEPARLMEIAVRETDRLDGLIGDFLQFARPRPLRVKTIRLDALAAEVVEMFGGTAPAAVEVVADPYGAVEVRADPDQLRQVLWNLLLNGVQAMPQGGRLRVSCCEGGEPQDRVPARRNEGGEGICGEDCAPRWAEIVVSDTGVGMSSEEQERIFEPFFTTKADGSGLGLATVHRVVEAHRGSLQVKSVVGQGTSFRIRIPRGEGGE